jgi:hypothetical protein
MYRAYGLLQPSSDFSLDAAIQRLSAKFPEYLIARNGPQITVAKGDWEIQLLLNEQPYVAMESEGLAGHLAGPEGNAVRLCTRRVEVWSDTPDPFLEHFNDYLRVIEVLKSFQGLIAVDPKEPNLL